MNREKEIKQAAKEYTKNYDCFDGDIDDIEIGFMDGAEWADEHPANFWHRVADGDLPTLAKGDDVSLPFLIEAKDGSSCRAYYGYDEFDVLEFFDDCGCALNVEYWAEIPKLPENNK